MIYLFLKHMKRLPNFYQLFLKEAIEAIPSYFQKGNVFVLALLWSEVKSLSRVWLFVAPWTLAYEAPLPMGFYRQEYWSGLPFPSPGHLPDPGIEHWSPASQADTLPSKPPGKLCLIVYCGKSWSSGPCDTCFIHDALEMIYRSHPEKKIIIGELQLSCILFLFLKIYLF